MIQSSLFSFKKAKLKLPIPNIIFHEYSFISLMPPMKSSYLSVHNKKNLCSNFGSVLYNPALPSCQAYKPKHLKKR